MLPLGWCRYSYATRAVVTLGGCGCYSYATWAVVTLGFSELAGGWLWFYLGYCGPMLCRRGLPDKVRWAIDLTPIELLLRFVMPLPWAKVHGRRLCVLGPRREFEDRQACADTPVIDVEEGAAGSID